MSSTDITPAATTMCTPAYILLHRDLSGGYTTYTFDTLKAVGKWAIDTMAGEPPPTTKPSTTTVSVQDNISALLSYDLLVDPSSRKITLEKGKADLLAECIYENPTIYLDKLFILPHNEEQAKRYTSLDFSVALGERKADLVERLMTVQFQNKHVTIFHDLYDCLYSGLHHITWDRVWEKVGFLSGIGVWDRKNFSVILKVCMKEWMSQEKPSDAVRDFFIKVFTVRNYLNVHDENPSIEIGSSEFLSSFTTYITNIPHIPYCDIPRQFGEWVSRGVTYSHCKAALTSIGVPQVRRSCGQVYKGILYMPIVDNSVYASATNVASINLPQPYELGPELAVYEKPSEITEDTNLLLTPDFNRAVQKSTDPATVYSELINGITRGRSVRSVV